MLLTIVGSLCVFVCVSTLKRGPKSITNYSEGNCTGSYMLGLTHPKITIIISLNRLCLQVHALALTRCAIDKKSYIIQCNMYQAGHSRTHTVHTIIHNMISRLLTNLFFYCLLPQVHFLSLRVSG